VEWRNGRSRRISSGPPISLIATCVPAILGVSGKQNAEYTSTFVFDNDHPSVGFESKTDLDSPAGTLPESARPRHCPSRLL